MSSSNFKSNDRGGKKTSGPGKDKPKSFEGKFKKKSDKPTSERKERKSFDKERKSFDKERKSFDKDSNKRGDRPGYKKSFDKRSERSERSEDRYGEKGRGPGRAGGRDQYRTNKKPRTAAPKPKEDGVRLNKYLAHAGIASRREADKLISAGLVKINGKVVTELGTKVMPTDQVTYGDEKVKKEALRYVLLNKPKDFITTAKDPQNRRTVLELIGNACKERVLPVGRLDRNTTGVLLFTNDGDMAKKLTHPRYRTKKVYQVTLDKPLSSADMQKIREGLKLEEGTAQVDEISYLPNEPKTVVGLEIHIGWNRIVRRIFESLGYKVLRLDRTFFAGLTKKNLKRGQWRFLTQEEINRLKMIS